MYMGPALLAQLINYKDASSKVSNDDWSLLTKQFTITWEQLRDAKTGLMYHGMTATPATTDWSKATDATSYHSGAFWGRANAWYMLALVDVLEVMPSNNANYSTLKGYLENLAASIASYQNEDGTWYQVLDQKDNALNGNYEESSCSALFTAAYLKAIRLKLLDSNKYETMAKKAYVALVDKFMSYDKNDNSKIQILSSCCSAGLGTNGGTLRKGTRDYYINGNDSKAVTGENTGYYYTEGKVLGGFIMAATEYERAYQNQDSKKILFAKDLAPKYDFSTTAGSLDATAYGTGAEKATYQWYKDGNAVDKATFATYTPTESGRYYCIAKAGNNTIQTSATTVTAKAATEGGDNNSGETTATKTATFSSNDLGCLDSSPNENERQSFTSGDVTIAVGTGFNANKTNLRFPDGGNAVATISTTNGAKIKKITLATNSSSRQLTFNPTSKGSQDKNNKQIWIYEFSGASSISVKNNSGSGINVSNIIVEYENEIVKTDLTASFSQSTIDATEGDASVDVPALTVKAGDKNFTDYKAEYTTKDANVAKVEDGKVVFVGKGTTTISVNVIPNNTTLYNDDCKAEFTVNVKEKAVPPVEPTETTNVYDFKTKVGTAVSSNTAIEVTADNIVFGANYKPKEGKYITISPADGGFKAGDLITITGKSTKGNALMTLNSTLDSETSEQYQFNALGSTETTYQYLLQADCQVLYLGRAYGSTATITGLTVTRAAAAGNKTRLVATFPSNSITVVNTTGTIELPALTVKAGGTELTSKQYTVVKKSDNPAVATISGNEITIKSIGTATIFATITPTEQTKYEGCIATYQVTVKEPTPLSVSTMDVTMNTVDAEVKQPVIKVYGDNDKLLTLGKDYTLTYSVKGENVTVDEAGMFKVAGEPYKWTEGSSTVTVKATPTTTLGNTYKEGTLTFEYNVIKGKITPVFHESFNDATIRVKTDNKKDKTFSVPLIYDGEDVSEYFDYTYTISDKTPAEINKNNKVSGNTLTFRPAADGIYTIKVTATPKKGTKEDGSDNYTDVYNNPVGISFTVVVNSTFIRPTVTVDPSTMTMYTDTRESAADVTVMNGKDIIPDNDYKLAWRSFTPGIVKVDANGNIEAVSEGNGDIRVSVYGENLETMTAFLKVYVDDPALYRAKTTDNDGKEVKYGNQRVMWNQNKTMSVSLGGWMFPNDVTTSNNITDEGLKSSYAWDNKASLAKWKLTGFDHFVMSNSSKNARQENGSNARPESTTISSRDFKTYTSTIKDQMFNVPCSGSYLVFNPATNGVVNVHIFQNGVFDASGNDRVYSPQRRVFVMDEAGNFVSSSAQIESTTGKPTDGLQTIDKYKWDLNPNGADTAPTIETVRSHFKNMPETFDMTADGFKNNVYESNLSTDIVPNDAATKNPNRKGVTGWSVLADSPVTYSFRVKAGKTYYLYNFGSKIGFYGYSFEEDATKPKVDEVNYDEAATNTVTPTEEGHVAKVTINRKFTKGIWTTCVLPFSLNKHQVDAIFGTTYGITNNVDGTTNDNADGTQILYFDRVEGNKAYFVRHAYNTIVAGKPFLIKPAKDVESINTAAVTDYPYVTIENEKPADWCAGNGYAWVSSYSNDMTVQQGDCFISNKDGHFKNFVGDPGTLKGFRGYLKANLANVAKPQTLSVGMDSNVNEEGTSAIIGLTIDADGNIVTGVADGKVYNVNGQVVSEDSRNFGALPSGVYVINGKKYVK
jgi:rhamnogalacturonyl hydrolase YesR